VTLRLRTFQRAKLQAFSLPSAQILVAVEENSSVAGIHGYMELHSSEIPGQLAFIASEHAKEVLPAGWRMELRDASKQSEIRSRFVSFREHVCGLDLHHLLSLTGLYTLWGSKGALQREASYPEVAELEFLQAIALSATGINPPPLQPDEVLPFWHELSLQCHVASKGQENEVTSPLENLARIHAAYYRNPYGDEFFDRMTLAITKEYDDRYLRDQSFSQAGSALVVLRREIRQRFMEYEKSCRIALTSDRLDVLELLRRQSSMTKEEFDASVDFLEIEDLRQMLLQAAEDEAVENMFVLGADWIRRQEREGVPMTAVLDRLSLGRTDEIDASKLAAANPIWSAPVVKTAKGYALYSPFTLTSFPFRCLLSLLVEDTQSKSRLEKVRGHFVEQEGRRLLEKAFPSAHIVLGGYWQRTPTERIETDLLLLTANRLFIFEAKGALIPDRVRFGAPDATVQFLKKIWGKATTQGAALADHLEQATVPTVITNQRGETTMVLDPTNIRSVSRFGISVEQVGPLMNAPDVLREAGVLNRTVVAAPCVILSELAQVFQHAGDELHRLHYLLRRAQVSAKHQICGDEMDIYTTYIQFGFSELPDSEKTLMLLGASYTLNDYRDDSGIVGLPSDSALLCSPYFQKVLRRAKDRASPAYLELGMMLLDLPYREQQELEHQLEKIFEKQPISTDWPIAMIAIDAPSEKSALAIVLIDGSTTSEERRTVGMKVAAATSERLGTDHVACIVRLWQDENAYDAVYVFGKPLRTVDAGRTTKKS